MSDTISQSSNLTKFDVSGSGSGVSYPGGHYVQAASTSPTGGTNVSNLTGSNGSAPSDIEFISRAGASLNAASSAGWNVFTFRDTLNDALANGSLQGTNFSSPTSLLQNMPSDWKTMYAQNPEALSNLLGEVNTLVGVAQSAWNAPTAAGQNSSWQGSWTGGKDPVQGHIQQSQQSNAGTEKDGMADHPDYNGRLGYPQQDTPSKGLTDYIQYGEEAIGDTVAMRSGIAVLGSEEAATAAGTGALEAVGIAGAEAGTALAVGTGIAAAGVAVAAVGLAAIGYEIYKAEGGTGNIPFMDKLNDDLGAMRNRITSSLGNWFHH